MANSIFYPISTLVKGSQFIPQSEVSLRKHQKIESISPPFQHKEYLIKEVHIDGNNNLLSHHLLCPNYMSTIFILQWAWFY